MDFLLPEAAVRTRASFMRARCAGRLPSKGDRVAYASLLSVHSDGSNTTFIARKGSLASLLNLLLVLVRSVRSGERRCRRDFVLLRSPALALPGEAWAPFEHEGLLRHLAASKVSKTSTKVSK